jgi:SapC
MRPVLLNNVAHADLRVRTDRSAQLGDDLMCALAFPQEFRSLQAHYPLVFQKTADGTSFQPVALFGLQEGQNLFLGPDGWDAPCLPMAVEHQPFLIGTSGDELLVHVDLDSPRLSLSEGEPVFLPLGGHTDYLERITALLAAIHEGVQQLPAFIDALLRHQLLESFVLDIELDNGTQHRLAGLYTLQEDRLASLDGPALARLNEDGHLLPIYMAMASLSQLRGLIERQNRRLASGD